MAVFHLRQVEQPEAVLQLPEPSAPVWWRCDDTHGLDVDLGVHYATDTSQLPDRIGPVPPAIGEWRRTYEGADAPRAQPGA